MGGITFDTGALVAADKSSRGFWIFWKASLDIEKTIPSGVLAQAWRGDRNARIAMVIAACAVEPLNEQSAREVGELCGSAGTSDVVDAMVVRGAARRRDDIVTSDPNDMRLLAGITGGVGRILDVSAL